MVDLTVANKPEFILICVLLLPSNSLHLLCLLERKGIIGLLKNLNNEEESLEYMPTGCPKIISCKVYLRSTISQGLKWKLEAWFFMFCFVVHFYFSPIM